MSEFDVENVEFEEIGGRKYVLIYGNDRNIYCFPTGEGALKADRRKCAM